MLTRRHPGAFMLFLAIGGATSSAQAQDGDTTTTIIDVGGGAKGYEPTNVQVVPGDGALTVYWTPASRPGMNDNEIWHAVRWSQTRGIWDNPGASPDRFVDSVGLPIDGIVIEPGVTSYKITGLKNRVVTGVHVRSFTGPTQRTAAAATASRWVRVKGANTMPVANEVTFDDAGYSIAEGGTVSLGLSRYGAADNSLEGPLTVTLATADGTASSSDYTAFSDRSVAMAANAATTSASVVTASDDLVEEDETFTVTMSAPDGSVFGAGDPSTTTITIEDDDRAAARIAFGSDAASTIKYTDTVAEAVTGGTLNVPVTVSHLPGESTTFTVEVLSGGTATEGSDFSIAAKSVTFGPTDSSKTKNVAITLTDDRDYENDETIELRIVAADAVVDDLGDHYARNAAGATATVTVTSADTRSATKTYSIPSAVSATEGGNAHLILTLGEAAPTDGLAFLVSATYDTGAGKAVPGDVKGFRSSSHTVVAGKSSDTISIPIPADGLVENRETFHVTVTTDDISWSVDPDGGNTTTVTVIDKDGETAKIAFGTHPGSTTKYAATVSENSPDGYLNVPISINYYARTPITFNVEVLEIGTATKGDDYSIAVNPSVQFTGGRGKTDNLRITLRDDSDYEEDKTIELRIVAADIPVNDLGDHYARHGSGATATITITSDESHFVTVNKANLTVEKGGTVTYTVVLTDEPTAEVTVTPTSSTVAATVSGPVTFTRLNWSVPQEITVTGIEAPQQTTISHQVSSDDANFASAKTVSVKVAVVAATVTAPTLTPTPTPAPVPTKFYEITSAVEGNEAELMVTLSEATPADMTFNVNYKFGGSTANAADTDAGRPTIVAVASGNTTTTLNIPIARDSLVESDETLKLSIAPGQGVTTEWGPSAVGADSAAVTIEDATITVSLGEAAYSVSEGTVSVSVAINFSGAIPQGVRVSMLTLWSDKSPFLTDVNIARGRYDLILFRFHS